MCLYARNISAPGGRRLQGFIRRGARRIKKRRATVAIASDQGFRVSAIARQYHFSEAHVRSIVRSFNEEGFAGLEPKYRIERPAKCRCMAAYTKAVSARPAHSPDPGQLLAARHAGGSVVVREEQRTLDLDADERTLAQSHRMSFPSTRGVRHPEHHPRQRPRPGRRAQTIRELPPSTCEAKKSWNLTGNSTRTPVSSVVEMRNHSA